MALAPAAARRFDIDALTFDEDAHRYACAGIVVPSVTQILDLVPPRSRVLQFMTRAELADKRALGLAVHAACHYYDEGRLDPDSVDPLAVPFLRGWIKFLTEADFVPELMETFVLHPTRGYSGRFDRLGRRRGGRKVLLDIKTGDPSSAAAGPQTAAYLDAYLARLGHWEPVDRLSVHLMPDTYREHPHRDRSDTDFFNAAHTIFCREGRVA